MPNPPPPSQRDPETKAAAPQAASRETWQPAPVPSSSTSKSAADGGTRDALLGLVRCIEQILRELPRGASAQLTRARSELKKAREALGTSAPASSPSAAQGSMSPTVEPDAGESSSEGESEVRTR